MGVVHVPLLTFLSAVYVTVFDPLIVKFISNPSNYDGVESITVMQTLILLLKDYVVDICNM